MNSSVVAFTFTPTCIGMVYLNIQNWRDESRRRVIAGRRPKIHYYMAICSGDLMMGSASLN